MCKRTRSSQCAFQSKKALIAVQTRVRTGPYLKYEARARVVSVTHRGGLQGFSFNSAHVNKLQHLLAPPHLPLGAPQH